MLRTGISLALFLAFLAPSVRAQAISQGGGGDGKPHYVWPRSIEDDRSLLRQAAKWENRDKAIRTYAEIANGQDASLREQAEKVLAGIPDDQKREAYLKILDHSYHLVRQYVAQHIAALKDKRAVPGLYKLALGDVDAGVRLSALHALKDLIGGDETVKGLGEAAWSEHALVRIRAIEGIGKVEEQGGVEILITRLHITYGGGPRCYFYTAEVRSYIRDYDVQVATGANAYEPLIGTISDGTVLDVKVLRIDEEMTIIEKRVLNSALENLTGVSDKNMDPNAWVAWWEKNQDDPKWHLAAK